MPVLMVMFMAVCLFDFSGCSIDTSLDCTSGFALPSGGAACGSSDLKLTKDYAVLGKGQATRVWEAAVIKTVMVCKNQGMKFVKWTRRCKFNQCNLVEHSYKCLVVFMALVL